MGDFIFIFILEIVSILFCFTYVICSFYSYPKYSLDYKYINTYKENWESGVITSIKLDKKKDSNKCSTLDYEPLISSKSPGIYEGCNCLNTSSIENQKKIINKTCTDYQLSNNCVKIKEVPSKTLIWKNSNLCIKRNENINYYKILKNTINNEEKYKLRSDCEKNEYSCGEMDTSGNLLCVENPDLCPLNYIDFNENAQKQTFTDNDIIERITLNDEDNNPLYYGTVFGKKKYMNSNHILNQFIVNNHRICSVHNIGEFGENNFNLNKKKGKGKCFPKGKVSEEYDNRYNIIDTDEGENFFSYNRLDTVLNDINDFYYDSETDLRLFSINYFGLNYKCIDDAMDKKQNKFNLKDLTDPKLKKNKKIILSISIISFVYFIFLGVQMVFITIYKKRFLGFEIAKIVFVLTIFILGCIEIKLYKKNNRTYNLLIDQKCFDKFTENSFYLGYKMIKSCFGYFIALLVICIIDLIMKIFILFKFCFSHKEEKIN